RIVCRCDACEVDGILAEAVAQRTCFHVVVAAVILVPLEPDRRERLAARDDLRRDDVDAARAAIRPALTLVDKTIRDADLVLSRELQLILVDRRELVHA